MSGPLPKRLVVKLGSALVTSGEGVRKAFLNALAQDVASLREQGVETILVSSGAVALGRGKLGLPRSARLDHKQAAAATGQPLLMQAWAEAFAPHGLVTAQLLLTVERYRRSPCLPQCARNDRSSTQGGRGADHQRE